MSLPLTGERTIPGHELEQYWFTRHEVVYAWAASELPRQGRILDAGCGEGYGAQALTRPDRQVVGLDYDRFVAAHVQSTYPDVTSICGNLVALPFVNDSFAGCVSFQVIEHIWDVTQFIDECVRVLSPGGVCMMSTPNRPVFSPGLGRGEKPTNPFHVEEYDAEQLSALFRASGLADVTVAGLHHAGRILAWERDHGSIVDAHVEAITGNYWPTELRELLPTISVEDFRIGPTEQSQDLIVWGVRA